MSEYDFRKGDHVEWTHGIGQIRFGVVAQVEWPLAHILGWNDLVPMAGLRLISRPVTKDVACDFQAGDLVFRDGEGSDVFTITSVWSAGERTYAQLESGGVDRGYEHIGGIRHVKPKTSATGARIAAECDALKAMLLAKNAAYGDSATDPVRVFSKASPTERILIRIDDKVSRLIRGHEMSDESRRDTIRDMIGYWILLLIAEES